MSTVYFKSACQSPADVDRPVQRLMLVILLS